MYIRPSSGALDVKLQHMVFSTKFLEGWWSWEAPRRSCLRCGWCRKHDLRSGSQDHHPFKNSVQKTIYCNLTSNAPDDGRMYTKHVELRIHQQITKFNEVGNSFYFMGNMHGQTTLEQYLLDRLTVVHLLKKFVALYSTCWYSATLIQRTTKCYFVPAA